ncbi:hypothetical protein HYH03_003977 [Edaphochlamys debaryana]|uniref:Sugar phosphate transporter domain-containing protein n=1 Tax=Edaphochlamys debaryana TaxID=47281 RepID=A0A835Y8I6_9CHLO|nr:hypothetical protein HYH03_003977 [Edaphochlamys debaryana]|eukprot:KAG2498227.1 hypothetical protein HYH03_003977 [Edaphochlamys debaryana]
MSAAANGASDGARQRRPGAAVDSAASAAAHASNGSAPAAVGAPASPTPSPSGSKRSLLKLSSLQARLDAERVRAAMWAVFATCLWMVCSSAVIILNNSIYRRGFGYPSIVTGVGQLFSAASGYVLSAVSGQRLRPLPGPRVFLTSLLPISACTAASMYFGNFAYLHLSLAFIQILKAFTPAITLLLCAAAGLERPTPPLAASIAMIALGTAGAVLVESGAPSFKFIGLASFMASSLTEAARVVGAELLKDGSAYNTAESLVYIGGPTALVLLACGLALEGPAVMEATARGKGLALVAADPWAFLAAPAVSAAVNMSCFLAIHASSSLTFKVAGCIKNVAVVAYGMLAHGERVSPMQMAGYGVSVGGFTLYSHIKMRAVQAARKKQS